MLILALFSLEVLHTLRMLMLVCRNLVKLNFPRRGLNSKFGLCCVAIFKFCGTSVESAAHYLLRVHTTPSSEVRFKVLI